MRACHPSGVLLPTDPQAALSEHGGDLSDVRSVRGWFVTATQGNVLALTASGVGRQSSLVLGIAALVLWAVSWSWLVGVGVTLVRLGEVGALITGLAAVAVGLRTRPGSVGFWLGVVALVLVVGLNLLGIVLR